MLSALEFWALLCFLGIGVKGANGGALHDYPHYDTSSASTTTITVPTTYVPYPNSTITTILPTTVVSTTIVPYPTVSLTTTTVTVTIPEAVISNVTVRYPTVVPTTKITTVIVPTTITPPVSVSTYTPPIITSVSDECPTTCSLVASTVRLFFWPTNNDYTYPSTYVSPGLDYTFTSPSVYLVIKTLYGTNSAGRAGPSGTSEVFALDLDQVSTILPREQITRQLTLNDLYTDCPQSIDPEVVATTIPDGHCDFSLLAPQPVKDWASPCNACGRLGLFDPPYAIPTADGGLIGTTVVTTDAGTTSFASTTEPASGATSTIVTATVTPSTGTTIISSTSLVSTPSLPSTSLPSSSTGPTSIPTASANRVTCVGGAAWLLVSCFVVFWL
ncbi:hypothetical protein F4802DRAFT_370795 [Xylaria palmicola]|nr:hypothetical protein F4802DRAFT_370795 [Xylaria palmicola]